MEPLYVPIEQYLELEARVAELERVVNKLATMGIDLMKVANSQTDFIEKML
jgi:hypothetical protein